MTVTHVTPATFKKEVLQKPLVIVDMWAEWCMPCKRLAPLFEELSNELKTVAFAKLNVEEHPERRTGRLARRAADAEHGPSARDRLCPQSG